MPRRNPRPRGRALGVAAAVVAGALAGAVAAPVGYAQPAADIERAKDLYRTAEAAMQDGKFDDAVRDYGAAYDLSKDPALLYKIARAHERAGQCETALIYYRRYLREGQPSEPFTALTRERIAACRGDAGTAGGTSGASGGSAAEPGPAAGSGAAGSGSATTGASAGSAAGSAASASPAGAAAGSAAEPSPAASAEPSPGSAAPARGVRIPPTREKVAWLLGGSAIALAALGGVLTYATNSAENDVRDLYAGFADRPPAFDAATRKRYDELLDDGRRYQTLAWTAFGLAGAAAVAVTVLFSVGGDEPAPAIAPVIGPRGAGVSVRF